LPPPTSSFAMKLSAAFLGLTLAADPTIFHDEHSADTHHVKDDLIVSKDGWTSKAYGRGTDNYLHAKPTRAPSATFDEEKHDWENHGNDFTHSPTPPTPAHTFAPSPAPTAKPTKYPTTAPTYTPTAIPTRDLTRIIVQCENLVPAVSESTWYHVVNGVPTACNNCGIDTKKCAACPKSKRCIASKQMSEAHDAADGSGSYPAQTYTSTCSHVHCKVKVNHKGQKVTEVKHHHAERYGSMHICQQGLHKDYDETLAAACGCECFDELAGDNDWLTGLAHRNTKKVLTTATGKQLAHWKQTKYLKTHSLRKKDDGTTHRYQAYKFDADGNPKAMQARHESDGTVTWLHDDGSEGTLVEQAAHLRTTKEGDHHIWNGQAPTTHKETGDHLGYENNKGVTMFGYN